MRFLPLTISDASSSTGTQIMVGSLILAATGAGVTLYYASESDAFRETLMDEVPCLAPLWKLTAPEVKVHLSSSVVPNV